MATDVEGGFELLEGKTTNGEQSVSLTKDDKLLLSNLEDGLVGWESQEDPENPQYGGHAPFSPSSHSLTLPPGTSPIAANGSF